MSAYAVSSRGLAAHKLPQGVLATIMEILFANGEKGIAKLDFSDFTGMYQDRARTVPYTAVEQPLGSFTGLNGVPATAPADVNRGVVSARVNHLLQTDDIRNAPWSTFNGGTATAANVFTFDLVPNSQIYQLTTTAVSPGDTLAASVKLSGSGTLKIYLGISGGTYEEAGVAITLTATPTVYTISKTYLYSHTGVSISISRGDTGTASSVTISEPQITKASDAHLPYQRVTSPTDYDTAGFPHDLVLNGVDQYYTSVSGGGSTTGFYFVAAVIVGNLVGARVLFSDRTVSPGNGTTVYIDADNKLFFGMFDAGGALNASVMSSNAAPLDLPVILEAWDDGVNLNVRINSGVTTFTPAPATRIAGETACTLFRNTSPSEYFGGSYYAYIYRAGPAPSAPQRESVVNLIRNTMRLP